MPIVPNPIVLDMDIAEPQMIPMTVAVSDGTIGMSVATAVVGGAGALQDKEATYTPSTATQTDTITPDPDYDGLSSVEVTVAAMPIGSAKTPTTTITANPSIAVSSMGLISVGVSASQTITPTVTAGYVSAGTAGTVSVSGSSTYQVPSASVNTEILPSNPYHEITVDSDGVVSAVYGDYEHFPIIASAGWVGTDASVRTNIYDSFTYQLPSQAATAITPTESAQTAVAAGKYTTGAITVNAIPSNYIGSAVPSGSLTVSGSTATAASGYYPSAVSANVASGYLGATTVIAGQTASTHTYKVERQAATSGWYEASAVRNAGTVILNDQSISASPTESAQTFTPTNSVSYITQVTVDPIPIVPPDGNGAIIEYSTVGGQRWCDITPWEHYGADGYVDVVQGYNTLDAQSFRAVASGTTITPSTASQTIGGADWMMEDAVTVNAVASASHTVGLTATYKNIGGRMFSITPKDTVTTAGWIAASTWTGNEWLYTALSASTITPTSADIVIGSANTMLEGAQTIEGIVCTNLLASNIASGVTVKIGTASDDDSVASVTGTYQGGITPTGTITLSSNTTGVDVAPYAFADVAVPWTWMGEEPTVVNSSFYSDSYLLGSTSYNGWAGSTTAKIIVASASAGTFVASAMNEYEYLINWQMDVSCTLKSTATTKAIPIRECANVWQLVTRRPSSLGNISSDNFNGNTAYTYFTAPWLKYYNTSGSSTYTWSNSYGIYGTVQTPTFSSTTADSPTVTLKTPIWYARCSSTYFATGRVGDIDQTETTLKRTCKIYRVKKGTPPKEMYEGLVSIINNPL